MSVTKMYTSIPVKTPVQHLMPKLLILLVSFALTACGVNSVLVTGTYPTPNITKLPMKIGVYYDQALRDFSYIEYTETGQQEYDIKSGESHMELFNTVLPAMFNEVVFIETMEQARDSGVDAVFAPTIEEFQLALPHKTKLDVYEVWVKYNMRLLSADGEYIADWVMTSYGKTPPETFRSRETAIVDAAYGALRDLGASFSRGFTSVPEVQEWLASK